MQSILVKAHPDSVVHQPCTSLNSLDMWMEFMHHLLPKIENTSRGFGLVLGSYWISFALASFLQSLKKFCVVYCVKSDEA